MSQDITLPVRTLGILNLPDFCGRCFWIRLRCQEKFPFQIPMPGIFNSIDGYSKKLIHTFFDQHGELPPWLPRFGEVKSYVKPLHYRWFNYEHSDTNITVRGTPDDLFQLLDDSYHVVDYKTAKVTGTQDELFPLYDAQLNAYAYIAKRLTSRQAFRPVSGLSLIYMEPETHVEPPDLANLMSSDNFSLRFKATARPVELRPDDLIPELLFCARQTFDSGSELEHIENCKEQELLDRLMALLVKQG